MISVGVGGATAIFQELQETIESDLARSEALALPIVLLLLIAVFGGVIAGVLPLGVGIVAVLGTLGILRLTVEFTEVSIFALNLTTALGLGIAIDYSLFIVSRFREELRALGVAQGQKPERSQVHAAVVRAVDTSGRTVLFSAASVAISLAALLVFPLPFLWSFAYAGIGVVLFSALGSVVMLPALLAVMGGRIDHWSLRRRREPKPTSEGFWHRVAVAVMRRPVPVALSVTAFLLVLGWPFLSAHFGSVDDRVLPVEAASRQVSDDLRENFASREATSMTVVVSDYEELDAPDLARYAAALSAVDSVARVDGAAGSYANGAFVFPAAPGATERFASSEATWLSLVPSVEPVSREGEQLVRDVRALPTPETLGDVLVGGAAAQDVDARDAVFSRVPLAAGLIALVTFVVLFLMFGSLLVPAKAVILNLLSLTATFGAMVWIFQQGHLSGVFDFTATGNIDVTTPILMFCIAFGLSMDYEVFLLSRIKEEHDLGLLQGETDLVALNERAVARGLERTGRIVTAAAALLAVVFIAFAFSDIIFIKMLGVGMALAVLMDATLVRGALVPAFMKLAGRANWWAPAPLRRIHERFGIHELPPGEQREEEVLVP